MSKPGSGSCVFEVDKAGEAIDRLRKAYLEAVGALNLH